MVIITIFICNQYTRVNLCFITQFEYGVIQQEKMSHLFDTAPQQYMFFLGISSNGELVHLNPDNGFICTYDFFIHESNI